MPTLQLNVPIWVQHLLVLLVVAACFGFVARHGVRSLLGKKSKLGSCCSRGCDAGTQVMVKPQSAERVQFFPSEMLTPSRRRTR